MPGSGKRFRGNHRIAVGVDVAEHGVLAIGVEVQIDVIGGDVGLGGIRGGSEDGVLAAINLAGHAGIVEIHAQFFGCIDDFSVGIIVAAVGAEGGDVADDAVLHLDDDLFAIHHHIFAGEAAPGLEPDFAQGLVIVERVALDLHGLSAGCGRVPVNLHVVLHLQFVGGGVVGGAGGFAIALFEGEAGGLVGIGAAGIAVAGDAAGADDGGGGGRRAIHGEVQCDLHLALGEEAAGGGVEGGGGALDQVEGLGILRVDLHDDFFEIDAGSVLDLLHALRLNIGAHAPGGEVFVAVLPAYGGRAEVRRERGGGKRRIAGQFTFLG